jgi:GTP-binding protein
MSQFPGVTFMLSVASREQFPADEGVEIAFAGRSNSGKSSAINAIMARNGLARTSKTPGRTKLLNFFELEPGQRIIDLPGYGYAEAHSSEREQWTALIDALPARASLAGLFLIVDIRRGISPQDEQLIDWAMAAGWQVHVLLAKSDKLNQRERAAALKEALGRLEAGMTVQVFSAHDRTGVQDAQKRLIQMLKKESPGGKPPGPD